MNNQHIVVIGGGFGGVAAARTARSLLSLDHKVTLVDRNRRTYLCGAFPLLIVGERESTRVSRSLGTLANRGINFIQAEVRRIDLDSKAVATSTGTLEYDHPVVAPGAAYDWGAVPGARDASSFYDIESARLLRRRLSSFRKGRIIVAVSSLPYKCPPAPFEAAMILDWSLELRGVRSDVDLHVSTPEPAPLPVAGPETGARLVRDLRRRGIQLHTSVAVTEVARNGREVAFSDGRSMDADLVITIPPHRVPQVLLEAGLTSGSGWVEVSPQSLETRYSGVYAVGDTTFIPMANGRPLPKAGVLASAEGETAGHNIAAHINSSEPSIFQGAGHCFIAYGGDRAGVVRGSFLAEGKPKIRFEPPSAH